MTPTSLTTDRSISRLNSADSVTTSVAQSPLKTLQTLGSQPKASSPFRSDWLNQIGSWLFFGGIAWLLWRGWQVRDQQYLTAESGVGYWLGIVGGSLMLALLLYPVRKQVSWMRHWGPIRYWFRTHMIFGVLGPTLILFHSNFSLGSTNSRVALFCMLLVAGSGLIGRYFYSRIHFGLFGKRASLIELTNLIRHNREQLDWVNSLDSAFCQRLETLETNILAASDSQGINRSPMSWLVLRWHCWKEYRVLRQQLKKQTGTYPEALKFLSAHQMVASRVMEFRFFERMFALWHLVHMPFFIMLVVSGVVHVIAVHLY